MIGTIITERLILRPISVDDAPEYYRFYSDPEVMRYIGKGDIVESVEKVRDSIKKHQHTHHLERNIGLWSVFLADDNDSESAMSEPTLSDSTLSKPTMIGHCGVLYWEINGVIEYEIAYLLGKEYWGFGYATEAAGATRDWGFSERNYARMVSLIYPENIASQKVAERIGMVYEKDVIVMDGVTVRMYALNNPNTKSSR